MDEKTLYETVLGLEAPWSVVRVELRPADAVVKVHVESGQNRWPCPEYKTEYDFQSPRPTC